MINSNLCSTCCHAELDNVQKLVCDTKSLRECCRQKSKCKKSRMRALTEKSQKPGENRPPTGNLAPRQVSVAPCNIRQNHPSSKRYQISPQTSNSSSFVSEEMKEHSRTKRSGVMRMKSFEAQRSTPRKFRVLMCDIT